MAKKSLKLREAEGYWYSVTLTLRNLNLYKKRYPLVDEFLPKCLRVPWSLHAIRTCSPQKWKCIFTVLSKLNVHLKAPLRMSLCACAWSTSSTAVILTRNKSTQRYKPVQAEFCPVIYGKQGVYGLNRWCQDEQHTQKRRSHDSFPKPWKRAKGQTNQWQFGWYLASSTDRPASVWHECKCEKCSFL